MACVGLAYSQRGYMWDLSFISTPTTSLGVKSFPEGHACALRIAG